MRYLLGGEPGTGGFEHDGTTVEKFLFIPFKK